MPHERKGCPKIGTLGVVLERASELRYRFDALTLEYLRDVLYLGQAARRWPVDDFRELPLIEVLAESTGCGGIRPFRDEGFDARLDGFVVVLAALERGIHNDGPDVVPATADFS
ncbi:hypothetical protein [Pseudarthrobacter sp. SSS035]|uniref:hypothetical protein n=1 Tax=Pseudarthrobacter sp. SSS035 TaxID=2931399 RepID=UPI00200CD4D2|nr:hypothetical protein [Pseudarthrobacter sp. SSS035]